MTAARSLSSTWHQEKSSHAGRGSRPRYTREQGCLIFLSTGCPVVLRYPTVTMNRPLQPAQAEEAVVPKLRPPRMRTWINASGEAPRPSEGIAAPGRDGADGAWYSLTTNLRIRAYSPFHQPSSLTCAQQLCPTRILGNLNAVNLM